MYLCMFMYVHSICIRLHIHVYNNDNNNINNCLFTLMGQRNTYAKKQIKRKLYDNITTKLQLLLTVIDKHIGNMGLKCLRVSIHR